MKIKNKGKVFPSPSPSSSSSSSSSAIFFSPSRDSLSVLNLLPAAILALTSILSLQDREVLAYLITRSLKTTTTTTTNASSPTQDSKKKSSKKLDNGGNGAHKAPIFDCGCFDCYTSYWYRWDSSENRELIHQAIEAFEDHLSHGELSKKTSTKAKRSRDKTTRRLNDKKPVDFPPPPQISVPEATIVASPENDVAEDTTAEVAGEKVESAAEMAVVVRTTTAAGGHKGLARKVLPDVIGLLISRLWNLWSPND